MSTWRGHELTPEILAEARRICETYCRAVACNDGCKSTWPGCGGGALAACFEEAIKRVAAKYEEEAR